MTNGSIQNLVMIAGALGDENRARALLALSSARSGELCLCQITELLGLAPSTVSKHLSLLKQAGLVESRKQGRWMFYRIAAPSGDSSPAAREAIDWLSRSLQNDPRVLDDAKRLQLILQLQPEELCKQQVQKRACCSSAPATPGV